MYLAVYVCSATTLFTDLELDELLATSRKNNSALDITGMLLYKDGNFMQILEGPKDKVQALMKKIQKDPRHQGVIVLLQQDHPKREFDHWAMAFRKIEVGSGEQAPGHSNFLDLPLISKQFQNTPSKSLKLLLSFRETVSGR